MIGLVHFKSCTEKFHAYMLPLDYDIDRHIADFTDKKCSQGLCDSELAILGSEIVIGHRR